MENIKKETQKKILIDSGYYMSDQEWQEFCKDNDIALDDWETKFLVEQDVVSADKTYCQSLLDTINIDENILVIADLGLWNGRVSGYKELSNNPQDVLYIINNGDDDYSVYCNEKNEVFGQSIHHDGTNYYRFRVWKKGVPPYTKTNFLKKIYNNMVSEEDVIKYTKALKISKKYLS